MVQTNVIYNSDCLGENGMSILPEKSVDMILADPPYGTTRNKWDSILPLDELWKEYNRIIKDNGAIVLTAQQPFTTTVISSNMKYFRYEWIWQKSTKTGFLNAHRQPLKNHENVCVFYKKLPNYNPQTESCEKITKRGSIGNNYMNNYANEYIQKETGYPCSIIQFKSVSKPIHPTQKPVELFEYLINTYTKEGDVVLDNVMGSGTTAIACINTNRQYIGWEKEKEYYDMTLNRIAEHSE